MIGYKYILHQLLRRSLALAAGLALTIGISAQDVMETELGTRTVFSTEPCAGCTCIWYLDGMQQSTDAPRLEVTWEELGLHTVSVQFEWENCFSPLTDFAVKVKETPKDPLVPSPFFTPNGDGGNDTWEIQGIEFWPDADIKIYNRFHKLIAHYRGDERGWDGNYLGHPCVSDDYWYLIRYDNGAQQLSGHVTLKR